jgi:hypothetical protein
MDSEEDPFETEEEEAYNRAIRELAKAKSECATQLENLQQKVVRLASGLSGGTAAAGDGDSAVSPVLINGTVGSGNETEMSRNKTSLTTIVSGLFNSSSSGEQSPGECPVCPDPVERDCPPAPEFSCSECPPVSTSPDECGPSTTSRGDPDTTDSPFPLLATPEAVLVGAAATLLVLLLAAVVGLFLRYVPVLISGLLILVLVAVVWYLSSKYPGAARRLGARIWEALRRGATAVVERLFRRDHPEVSVKYVCRGK